MFALKRLIKLNNLLKNEELLYIYNLTLIFYNN